MSTWPPDLAPFGRFGPSVDLHAANLTIIIGTVAIIATIRTRVIIGLIVIIVVIITIVITIQTAIIIVVKIITLVILVMQGVLAIIRTIIMKGEIIVSMRLFLSTCRQLSPKP